MSTFVERLYGRFADVPSELLRAIDRNFQIAVLQPRPFATTLSGWTFSESDTVSSLQVSAAGGAKTVYLPPSPTGSRTRRVVKTDSSGNAVTVSGNGYLINGSATYVLAAQYDYVEVEPTGAGWLVVNAS